MSRKARIEDKTSWKMPSVDIFAGEYGPFRAKGYEPIESPLVWFHYTSDNENGRHKLHSLAGMAQELLLGNKDHQSHLRFSTIISINLKDMFESKCEYEEALEKEMDEVNLTKGFGKTLLRLLQRLMLKNVIVAGQKSFCAVLIKLYQSIRSVDSDAITEVWLLHSDLSTKFINKHLVSSKIRDSNSDFRKSGARVYLVLENERMNRVEILSHFFQIKNPLVVPSPNSWLSIIANYKDLPFKPNAYDPDYMSNMGKQLFLTHVKVEMNRHTKQYERICDDITSELIEISVEKSFKSSESMDMSHMDWSTCERHIGALVLRGNRCVLVRSLSKIWEGMKVPSVVPKPDESPQDAAIRAVLELVEVDASEVNILPHIFPVAIYGPSGQPILVELYPLYATEPPPDGALEDADLEDDETPYDWYTYKNALKVLDKSTVAALGTMSFNLIQSANVGLLPNKWGGVFGQEIHLQEECERMSGNDEPEKLLNVKAEEWNPTSSQKDVLENFQMTDTALKLRKSKKLPVTLLSGFLGSGKTTLLSYVLCNLQGLKVAVLVNDMAEINIDAALIKNNANIHQREEHLVELSNGCICCTLREDLLIEVANIAADSSFDYLLIESTGVSEPLPVAETFTFEDSKGSRLKDVAEMDTMVTVIDGSRFMSELDSLESLRARNWHADPEDQRTISHLLCDQVEFANVIVLNKCDLMSDGEKAKVKILIKNMNPTAKLIEATYGNVPLDMVLNTGLFSISEAEKHENWLKEARFGEHTPETEEYGIGSFTYRAYRPFLPSNFDELMENILQKSHHPFDKSNIIRAKGFIWLANCPRFQGDFSLAGNHYSLIPGNPWWAEIDKSDWPENLEREIAPLWHEPYGDRQQEIVIIGQSLDVESITKALDDCLVPDESMQSGLKLWGKMVEELGNPYQDAWIHLQEEGEGIHHHHDHHHGEGIHHHHDHHHGEKKNDE